MPEARVPVPDKPPGEIDAARAQGRRHRPAGDEGRRSPRTARRAGGGAAERSDIKQGPGVGTASASASAPATKPACRRATLITSNATDGSGGINTAAYSREHRRRRPRRPLDDDGRRRDRRRWRRRPGGGGARGRGDGTGSGIGGGGGTGGAGGTLQQGGSGKASRSIEDDQASSSSATRASIYAIYNRALREEPSLQGKVVLEADDRAVGQRRRRADRRRAS